MSLRLCHSLPAGRKVLALFALIALVALLVAPGAIARANAVLPLVINEIDYDQVSTDASEFLELYNPNGVDVNIDAYTVELVNGTGGGASIYQTIDLPNVTVAAYDYYVICANAATTVNCDLDVSPDTNLIQNGAPDAVGLRESGVLVDAVSYEGDTGAPYTETSGAGLVDDPVDYLGISRYPNGTDTNVNNVDLSPRCITPGAANGAANSSCIAPVAYPVINEFVASHTGTDNYEYVEVYGNALMDYSAYAVLHIEGDTTGAGVIDSVYTLGSTDASGYWTTGFLTNGLENGTITLLLVTGFTGAVGNDLDTNNDGVFDVTPWSAIIDDVAVNDGGAGDFTYSATALVAYYDGAAFAPGGASRIPNGIDTDTTADWVRNDFDLAGIPGFTGTPAYGEAYNTPGVVNAAVLSLPFGACGDNTESAIHAVQGSGTASPLAGFIVTVEGVVVGDFEDTTTGLDGFFLQEEDADADADPATSEGIFIYNNGFGPGVALGDVVRVQGTATEYYDLTELTGIANLAVCSSANPLPAAAAITLPVPDMLAWEAAEGMQVSIAQTLYATENYTWGRYGEVALSVNGRLDNPTNVVLPGAPAIALQALNDLSRIQLDDGSTVQNPLPLPPYIGADNTLRAGDTIPGLSGVLGYAFDAYEIHPTGAVTFTRVNERPAAPPDVGGTLTVTGFNVLNYFTTLDNSGPICGPSANLDCRGADTADEFTRQRTKIIDALAELDADVVGLMEIENNDFEAAADLVAGLNGVLGAGTYDYIDTGFIGTDAIKVALIYKPASVTPYGDFAILDSTVDPTFLDAKNRPVLAQTFEVNANGALFTVAVNHLKSKGSACDDVGDPDTGDGQGNCNLTRTAAAAALVNWLATDPTGSGDSDFLIIGDLNSYAMEDPIAAITGAGYTDLVAAYEGMGAYTYVFEGQKGYLDHALASADLTPQVTGADIWHINADEPSALDYNDYNQPLLYQPDKFRSSDHDPIVVGLDLNAPPVCSAAYPSINQLWPADSIMVPVSLLGVSDPDGDALTLSIDSIFQDEPVGFPADADFPDGAITGPDSFLLRAQRLESGDGRVYHIAFTADDGRGGACSGEVLVEVPLTYDLDPAGDGGALYNSLRDVPQPFDLIEPADGSTTGSTSPVFTWHESTWADEYKLVIKTASGTVKFKAKFAAADICTGGICTVDLGAQGVTLKSGKTYTWKVKATNELGKAKSAKWTFTTP